MNNSQTTNELEYKNIDSLLLKYSIPTTISTFVIIIQGITDRYFIGKYVGTYGMDATAVLFPLIIFISGIAALLSVGGGNLFAISLGEKNIMIARKVYNLCITLGIFIGIFYSLFILIFSKYIILFFGANIETYNYVQNYNLGTTPFAVFQILFVIYTTFIRINGDPKLTMFYGIINICINIILNYIFIVKLNLAIFGAGIATSFSSIILVIIIIIRLKNNKLLFFNFREFYYSFNDSKRIISIGSGSFIGQLLNAVTIILMNRQLIKYGTSLSLASFSIISMARTLINLPTTGINQGRTPILSYNFGAKQYLRVRAVTYKSIFYGVSISLITTILTLYFGKNFIHFFIDNNLTLTKITLINMKYHLSFMFATSLYLTTSTYFQGIGEGKVTFNLAIFRLLVIFIPLLLILPIYFGEVGVWIAFPISEVISGIISFFIMNKSLNKLEYSTFDSISF